RPKKIETGPTISSPFHAYSPDEGTRHARDDGKVYFLPSAAANDMEETMRARTGLFCLASLLCAAAVIAGEAPKPAANSKEAVFKRGVPFFIGDVKVEEGKKVTVSISANPAAAASGGLLALHPEHPILQIA